jgi:hypothetical protein
MLFKALLALVLLAQQGPEHSTHYPRHGGQFVTDAGDTVHIEAVWPRQGLFRLYLYDQSSQPLPVSRLRAVTGRVMIGHASWKLVLREHDRVFEARIPVLKLPGELDLELKLTGRDAVAGYHFVFPVLSDEHAMTFALEPTVIPATLAGLLDALRKDVRDCERLIDSGQSAYAFGPAVRARDHGLALERYAARLAPHPRAGAESAVRDVVRAAWLVHTVVDNGTIEQTRAALEQLRAAVGDAPAAFGRKR